MAAETVSVTDPIVPPVEPDRITNAPRDFRWPAVHDATIAGFVAITNSQHNSSAIQSDVADGTLCGFRDPMSPPLDRITREPLPNPTAASASDPRIGTLVGRFRIQSVIASGGMGTVYKAVQCEPVQRTVALKMIRRGMADESTLRRFQAERQALALMDHPDIAQVFEADTTPDGNPYFAMEFCTGEPIDRYCKSQKLGLTARLNLVIRIARAVQQAHSRGVIHRDLKPGNVLVSPCEGGLSLKIIDFGIAKFTDDQWQAGDHEETRIGELVGTPAYMSPEQASGVRIDGRTDVFAIGAMLFKLMTDTTPLQPKTDGDDSTPSLSSILEQLQAFAPLTPSCRLATLSLEDRKDLAAQFCIDSPKKLVHTIRGDLDWITLRAIESDRTRRYATANDLADDLQRYLRHDPVTAVAPGKRYRAKKYYQRHRAPILASAAIFVVILVSSIVGGIGWWNYEQELAEENRRVAEEAEILINDAEASRRLATKGGPEADENFVAAATAIATAESLLSGRHGLPQLGSRLNVSRRALADDRSAMRLVQQLEDARERTLQIESDHDHTTFGRQAGLNDTSAAFDHFGIRLAITPADAAAEKLLKCPPSVHPHLIEALDFLILEYGFASRIDVDDAQQNLTIATAATDPSIQNESPPSIQSQFDRRIAHWAYSVLSIIDQDVWRTSLRQSMLTRVDRSGLHLLSESPHLLDQPVATLIRFAQVRNRLERSTDSIDLLRLVQRRHPENFWANQSLALALSATEDPDRFEQSLRYFTAAVSLRPQSAGARTNLATALLRIGDRIAAAEHLRVALTLLPENQTIAKRLNSLNSTD